MSCNHLKLNADSFSGWEHSSSWPSWPSLSTVGYYNVIISSWNCSTVTDFGSRSRWSADNVFTCLVNLLATTTAVTFIGLWRRRHPGFCYVLPGLLQLSAGWHCRRPSSAPPVSSKCCSSFGLRDLMPRSHHSSSCKPPQLASGWYSRW